MKNPKLISVLFISFFLLITEHSFSQAPTIEWQNTIGGSSPDILYSLQQTTDGGYILGGHSMSAIFGDKTEASLGSFDYWVVKLNSSGAIEWQNTIGGSSADYLYFIQQTTDGGYILGGNSTSGISGDKTEASMGGEDYWIVKLNSSGAIEWQNTIGGSSDDFLHSLQQTIDGGYILGGYSDSGTSGDKTEANMGESFTFDYWVVKINSIGAIEWQNTIGGISGDWLHSLQQTTDGGYILGGQSASGISGDKTEASLGNDYWVVKLNSGGAIEWENTIGGSGYDELYSLHQSTDGGYILGGNSTSDISGDKVEASMGGEDYWVVKLSSIGAIEWQNTIGGSSDDFLYSLHQTTDGGYILGGHSFSGISGDKTEASLGSLDYWVVKLNSSGAIEWQNTIGGSGFEELYSLQQTTDGGYLLGGYSLSGISGDKTEASLGVSDYWVVKLFDEGLIAIDAIQNTLVINCYPNPADNFLTIETDFSTEKTIYITNAIGQIVQAMHSSENVININLNNISNGIYFIKMEDGINSITQKFIKL